MLEAQVALVRKFSTLNTERVSVQQEVEAQAGGVEVDGETYLVIKTYGKPGRKYPDMASQTIQLDRIGAEALMDILRRTFAFS
jgi:hypothetical protein